jgi:hypothetical protein
MRTVPLLFALAFLALSVPLTQALDLSSVQPRPASRQELHLSDAEMTFPPLPPRNVGTFAPGPPFYGQPPTPMRALTVTIQSGTMSENSGAVTLPITVTLTNDLPYNLCFLDTPISHLWVYSIRSTSQTQMAPAPAYSDIVGKEYVQINLSKPKKDKSVLTLIEPGMDYVLTANKTIRLNSLRDTQLIAEITVDALLPHNAVMLLHTFSAPYLIPRSNAQPSLQSTH